MINTENIIPVMIIVSLFGILILLEWIKHSRGKQ